MKRLTNVVLWSNLVRLGSSRWNRVLRWQIILNLNKEMTVIKISSHLTNINRMLTKDYPLEISWSNRVTPWQTNTYLPWIRTRQQSWWQLNRLIGNIGSCHRTSQMWSLCRALCWITRTIEYQQSHKTSRRTCPTCSRSRRITGTRKCGAPPANSIKMYHKINWKSQTLTTRGAASPTFTRNTFNSITISSISSCVSRLSTLLIIRSHFQGRI